MLCHPLVKVFGVRLHWWCMGPMVCTHLRSGELDEALDADSFVCPRDCSNVSRCFMFGKAPVLRGTRTQENKSFKAITAPVPVLVASIDLYQGFLHFSSGRNNATVGQISSKNIQESNRINHHTLGGYQKYHWRSVPCTACAQVYGADWTPRFHQIPIRALFFFPMKVGQFVPLHFTTCPFLT